MRNMKITDGIKEKLGALGGAKGIMYIAVALIAGVLCLFISQTGSTDEVQSEVQTEQTDYRTEAEDQLRALLNSLSGVSGARVIITFSDGVRYEYGEGSYSRSDPPIIEEKPPRVGGVAIVCEGGENPAVQKKVIDLVCALYGIPSSRVSVSG